jgi:hypothetical protein
MVSARNSTNSFRTAKETPLFSRRNGVFKRLGAIPPGEFLTILVVEEGMAKVQYGPIQGWVEHGS